jgi:hypothetical protein
MSAKILTGEVKHTLGAPSRADAPMLRGRGVNGGRSRMLMSLRMTAVFDDCRQAKTGMLSSLRARSAAIGGWLADQWPKAAIAFGFVTIAWVVALGWGLTTFVLFLL